MDIQKSNNNISRIKDSNIISLKACILRIITLIGFNPEKIGKEQIDLIIDYLIRNYPYFNHHEIIQAFELGIQGKLDVNLNHYQSFNSMYVANVINSFKRYKNSEEKKPKSFGAIEDRRTKYSEEEGLKAYLHIKDIIEREHIMPYIACWEHACIYMENNNIIELDPTEREAQDNSIREDWEREKNISKKSIRGTLENMIFDSTFELKRAKVLIKKHFENKLK